MSVQTRRTRTGYCWTTRHVLPQRADEEARLLATRSDEQLLDDGLFRLSRTWALGVRNFQQGAVDPGYEQRGVRDERPDVGFGFKRDIPCVGRKACCQRTAGVSAAAAAIWRNETATYLGRRLRCTAASALHHSIRIRAE